MRKWIFCSMLFLFLLSACGDESSSNNDGFSANDVAVINLGKGNDGDMRLGTDSTTWYVYDGAAWRLAQPLEIDFKSGCTNKLNGTLKTFANEDYICNRSTLDGSVVAKWEYARIDNYNKKEYFNSSVKYGSVTDSRDGHEYKTVEIEGVVWMAENLNYDIGDSERTKCPLDALEKKCEMLGRLYSWNSAMGYKLTSNDSIDVKKNHQGICMDGWHIPDSTEWNSLLKSVTWKDLQSTVGWNEGTNASGFSIVPVVYDGGGFEKYPLQGVGIAFPYQGNGAAFLISTALEFNASMTSSLTGYAFGSALFAKDLNGTMNGVSFDKVSLSVRCVQNVIKIDAD